MAELARFGIYELELSTPELRRRGRTIRLQQQTMSLLVYMVQRAGTVLTREELQSVLWPNGTFVDFDFGIYSAINRLRRDLGDTAARPMFIETVPKQGYRFVAHVELVESAADTNTPEMAPLEPVKTDEPAVRRPDIYRRLFILASIISGLLLVVLAFGFLRRGQATSSGDAQTYRLSIALPAGQTVISMAISPRGDQIVYEAQNHGVSTLYRRYLNEDLARAIPGSEDGRAPAFSPDGQSICFYTPGKLKVADQSSVREIATMAATVDQWNVVWGDDNFIYFNGLSNGFEGVWRVRPTGGPLNPILQDKLTDHGMTYPFANQVLSGPPASMIFSSVTGPVHRSLRSLDLKSHESQELIPRGIGGEVLPTGHLLYYWKGNLFAAPFRTRTMSVSGTPIEVVNDVEPYLWMRAKAGVSRNGTLAYVRAAGLPSKQLEWVDPNGKMTRLDLPAAAYEQAEVSPGGNKLALVRQDEQNHWSVWIYTPEGAAWTRLLDSAAPRPRVVWSPDGKSVIAGMERENSDFVNLVRIPLDAPQKAERLTNQPNFGQFPQSWSAKANAVLFSEGIHPHTKADIMVLPLGNPAGVHALVATPGWDSGPSFAPDGRSFAYESEKAGRREIFVQGYDPQNYRSVGAPLQVTSGGGRDPLWRPDGLHLLYMDSEENLMEVSSPFKQPAKLLIRKLLAVRQDWLTRAYSLAPDGRVLILLDASNGVAERAEIQVIVNWFSELKRLSPVQ